MSDYATVSDLTSQFRTLTSAETTKANVLIPIVCSELRIRAKAVGKNLDSMIASNDDLADVAKSVTCDVVARMLMTSTNQEPMTQSSQSALGYSVSGTYLVPGGGLFIKKSELARLGLRRQRVGYMDLMGGSDDA